MNSEIFTKRAPEAIGAYSQGRVSNGLLFTSGQLPIDPNTGKMIEGSVSDLARQCLDNLSAIAETAGTKLTRAVKANLYLADMKDAVEVNSTYATYFAPPYPVRTLVQVAALPLNARIEIEAVIAL